MSSHVAPSRKRKEPAGAEPAPTPTPSVNRLLAGYKAHEFLTKGTLLGRRWDRVRSDLGPAGPSPSSEAAYRAVACILKADGAHVPGVVNPTQLARWLQM